MLGIALTLSIHFQNIFQKAGVVNCCCNLFLSRKRLLCTEQALPPPPPCTNYCVVLLSWRASNVSLVNKPEEERKNTRIPIAHVQHVCIYAHPCLSESTDLRNIQSGTKWEDCLLLRKYYFSSWRSWKFNYLSTYKVGSISLSMA